MLELANNYNKSLEEEDKLTAEQVDLANSISLDLGAALWSRTEKKHSNSSHLLIHFSTSSGVSE